MVTGQQCHPVHEGDDPLEPVLGEQDGDAEVVDQAGERGEHVLSGGGVERGRRLVEDEQARVHGEYGADRHPLLLATREGAEVTTAELGDPEQVERLLDPAAHRVRREAELLHAVGQLLLHGVGDEAGERVLPDVPDHVRTLARRVLEDADAVEEELTAQATAAEPRHQTGHDAEQRGLPGAGRPGDEDQLAVADRQVDLGQDRGAVVVDGDAAQLDHATTSFGSGAAGAATSPTVAASSAATVSDGTEVSPG